MEKRVLVILSLGFFCLFVLIVVFLNLNKKDGTIQLSQPPAQIGISQASPTPFPFEDLTIPYLRKKSYQSQLGELELAYEKANYRAYLTSYRSEGLKINGLLTSPTGDKPVDGWPAIVFVHGYIPPRQYQTLVQYSDYVDYLARNGFVVFKIDLRGFGNSEGEPGGAYYSSDYVIDVLNAYSSLQNAPFVNPKSIGLWGHSMAGNVVMRSFTAMPDIPAVVVWAGAVYSYVDFREYGIQDASYQPPGTTTERVRRRQQLIDMYGQPKEDSFFWKQMAPTNFLPDLKGSIQSHHATNDNVVNIEYSRNLNRLLDQTSVNHSFYEYSSGGHNLTGVSFSQAMQRTVEFFKKHLNKN